MDGREVLRRLKGADSSPAVVMISGHADVATAFEASKLGAFDFIEKPLESDRVLLVARNAVEQGRLRKKVAGFKENDAGRYRMVGVSGALDQVREAVARAAPTGATVLIIGESGRARSWWRAPSTATAAQGRGVRPGQLRHPES